MTVLITGGAGFIGANFIYYMLKNHADYRIICVDSLTYAGNIETLGKAMKNTNFRFYKADICDRSTLFDIFEKERPNIAVNFAAESHVDRSIDNPEIFLRTNILGTQVIADACLKYSTERFHQISTDEVYGDTPLESRESFSESAPLRASSPYSASKAAADLLALSYFRTYSLPVTISRCSNNYGAFQLTEKLIPLAITSAIIGNPIPIYGNGCNIRDWLYVDDHCKAIDLILHKGRIGEVYNIGGGNEMRNLDTVKYICEKLGKADAPIAYLPDRKGHDLRYAVDTSKIRNELGWQPETPFDIGIEKTIEFYREKK